MPFDSRVTRIAIFGKRHELWPVVALLQKNLPAQIDLIVVEDANARVQDAALTLPCNNRFHEQLEITLEELYSQCDGSLGLGTDCRNWQGDGTQFFAAPSGSLPSVNGVALHHLMLRAALSRGEPEKLAYLLNPFRICARTALAGKFAFPSPSDQSPAAMLGPTMQMDRAKYIELLRKKFVPTIRRLLCATVGDLTRSEDRNDIQSVHLEGGEEIVADLFIDVSGIISSLPDKNLPGHFHSLSSVLPFDKIIGATDTQKNTDDHGHTKMVAMDDKIVIETPLRQGRISELLYNSNRLSDDAARALLESDADPSDFGPGYLEKPWTGNLTMLGSAAASLGPCFSAEMRLLQEQAMLLVEHLPVRKHMDVESAAYNLRQNALLEEIRDFSLMPFVLNGRTGDFWENISAAPVPDSLSLRLEQFRSRGRLVPYDNGIIDRQLWIDMMIGFGLIPERYDPLAESIGPDEFLTVLKNLNADFARTINMMHDHGAYREDYLQQLISGHKI